MLYEPNIKILCNMIMVKSLHSILQFTPISFMFLLLSSQSMYAQQWQLKGEAGGEGRQDYSFGCRRDISKPSWRGCHFQQLIG